MDQCSFFLYTDNILLVPFLTSDFSIILFTHLLTEDTLQNYTNNLQQAQRMYIN